MAEWVYVKPSEDLGDLERPDRRDAGERIFIPETLTAHFRNGNRYLVVELHQGDAGEHSYTVSLGKDDTLRHYFYNATLVQMQDERGLASADLRDVPLRRLVQTALTHAVVVPAEGAATLPRQAPTAVEPVPEVPENVREAWPKGDRSLVYEWVNRVYVAALANGLPPTKTVAEKFMVNAGTGSRLTTYARKDGVLTASSANDPTKRKRDQHGTSADGNRGSRED